jgi:hypothetical protein
MFFKFSGKPVNTTYKMPETAFGMELPYIQSVWSIWKCLNIKEKLCKILFSTDVALISTDTDALVILSCDDNWMISQVAVEMIS